jgi:8-oxo-dGTP pyrophosphatase MutT (NUDIX family)
MPHRQRLLDLIAEYSERHPDEQSVVDRFVSFVRGHERCFERDCWAGHITGSAWLVNEARSHVLLTHHRKLGAWFQLGGHSDGESNTLLAARKEAEEESGLPVRVLDRRIFDLDVHEIPARKSDPAHFHYDVRFIFAAEREDFAVSEESLDLAWVEIANLNAFTNETSMVRMAHKWLYRYRR